MNESEFRDWARRAQGNFEERLRAVETKLGELRVAPPRLKKDEATDEMAHLAKQLGQWLHEGRLTGVAIALITEEGVAQTGWANQPFDRYALAGAVSQLWLEIMDRPDKETDDGQAEEAAAEAEASAGQ